MTETCQSFGKRGIDFKLSPLSEDKNFTKKVEMTKSMKQQEFNIKNGITSPNTTFDFETKPEKSTMKQEFEEQMQSKRFAHIYLYLLKIVLLHQLLPYL